MQVPSGTHQQPPGSLPAAVLVVDDDEDLRDAVCDLLSSMGIAECLSAGSLAELDLS